MKCGFTFFFQAEDGIRDVAVTGVQTCALPICISEFIDPLGRTYAATRLETEASVADRLRTSDVIPLYVRLGDWVGLLVVLATIGFAGVLVADKWRSGRLL